jgi:hypothetical protein
MGFELIIGFIRQLIILFINQQFTSICYHFIICYISLVCRFCHHRHIGKFCVLITETAVSTHRLSTYCFVVHQWAHSAPTSSSTAVHIVMCTSDSRWGFELETRFIDHFNTQIVTTLDYSAITNVHTLQLTVTHILVFSVLHSSLVISW